MDGRWTVDRPVLPHNIEVEQSVLGAMLVSKEAAQYGVEKVQPDDFFRVEHQLVFRAMQALGEKRLALDYVTLRHMCIEQGTIDDLGGPAFISNLGYGVPSSTNIVHYVSVLKDLRVKRDAYEVAAKIQQAVVSGEYGGTELLHAADGWILDLQQARSGGSLVSQSIAVTDTIADLTKRVERRGQLTGVDTGLTTLNEKTAGWQRGDLVVVAGRPASGKTGLLAVMAIAAARAGSSVAWFSLEMSRQQVEYRMLSQISKVPIYRILNGILTDYEYRRVSNALEELSKLPIAVDDAESLNPVDLRGRCRRHRHEHGLDVAFVDYLQLMTSPVKHETRATALADISRRSKMLARELEIPIVAMAQLNRQSTGRDDQRPRMSDLRESGAIEQDADIVVLIHRADHKITGDAELIVDKGRNVPSGSFIVHFDKDTVTFSDAHVPQKEPTAQAFPEAAKSGGVPDPPASGPRRYVRPRR